MQDYVHVCIVINGTVTCSYRLWEDTHADRGHQQWSGEGAAGESSQ